MASRSPAEEDPAPGMRRHEYAPHHCPLALQQGIDAAPYAVQARNHTYGIDPYSGPTAQKPNGEASHSMAAIDASWDRHVPSASEMVVVGGPAWGGEGWGGVGWGGVEWSGVE